MTRRALFIIAALAIVPALRGWPATPAAEPPASTLPQRLTGQELWKLSSELSEPDGIFRSDNLVSNEMYMQRVIPELTRIAKPARAYLGVGPEQNFTYIAAVKPAIAFIIDVRRGNLHLHLMYKALFELSADRSEFVSRLFSLKRPAALTTQSTAKDMFAAFAVESKSEELYKQNVAAIRDALSRKDRLGLPADDLKGIEAIYREFYTRGLDVHYEITPGSNGAFPSYADLMTATDTAAVARSFLASEPLFHIVKDLETRNLIVPVVGNFAGPKAIRSVAKYLRSHDTLVSAFYVSNVEQYLAREDAALEEFCASASTLPMDDSSLFIRSERGGFGPRGTRGMRGPGGSMPGGFNGNFSSQLHKMQSDLLTCTKS